MSSRILRRDDAMQAVSLFSHWHNLLVGMETIKRGDLHVVIMDPTKPVTGGYSFFEALLYEESFGNVTAWEHRYDEIARAKAKLTWRTGLPTSALRNLPHLLLNEDTVFYGSVVLDGIVVGVSGVESFFDEAIAYTIAAWLQALVKQTWEQVQAEDDTKTLGEFKRPARTGEFSAITERLG